MQLFLYTGTATFPHVNEAQLCRHYPGRQAPTPRRVSSALPSPVTRTLFGPRQFAAVSSDIFSLLPAVPRSGKHVGEGRPVMMQTIHRKDGVLLAWRGSDARFRSFVFSDKQVSCGSSGRHGGCRPSPPPCTGNCFVRVCSLTTKHKLLP